MTQPTSQMRDLAKRLIAYEARADRIGGTKTPAAFPVCEKLRPHLATLMGSTGVHALLARALARAAAEVPSLRAVQVNADGSLELVDKPAVRAEPQAPAADNVALVTQLLGLLVAFIGLNLTLRIVCDVWPQAALDDLYVFKEGRK